MAKGNPTVGAAAPAPSPVTAWEYELVRVPFGADPVPALTDAGEAGWELVTVYGGESPPWSGGTARSDNHTFVFKRPKVG